MDFHGRRNGAYLCSQREVVGSHTTVNDLVAGSVILCLSAARLTFDLYVCKLTPRVKIIRVAHYRFV